MVFEKRSELSPRELIANGSNSSFFTRLGEEGILLRDKECLATTLEIKQKPSSTFSEIKIIPECISERTVQNSLLLLSEQASEWPLPENATP